MKVVILAGGKGTRISEETDIRPKPLIEIGTKPILWHAEDAIWWSYVTITTVGYGDKFPVTTEGRIIGSILMTTGVGIFGTFTALVSSWFIDKK